jgi:CheY-like chemotaxis protein
MHRVVLIADDSDHLAATLEVALGGLPGTAVVSAPDGLRALEILEAGVSITALITDLQMPRMDGFELIRRVRADSRLASMAIIAVSGDSDPRTPARALKLGADAFFSKPFSPAGLVKRLARLIDRGPAALCSTEE